MEGIRSIFIVLLLVLQACGDDAAAPQSKEAKIRALQPDDATIAGLYRRSCASCHTIAATGAPLTGDRASWEPLMAKGMDTLVENVKKGFGRMPPSGLCRQCDDAQLQKLILFMASGGSTTEG